jgi:hypothetical protein
VRLPPDFFTPRSLLSDTVWNLATRHGQLDLSFAPSGFPGGYVDLAARAERMTVAGTSLAVLVAALDDIHTSKRVADRPKDRAYRSGERARHHGLARSAGVLAAAPGLADPGQSESFLLPGNASSSTTPAGDSDDRFGVGRRQRVPQVLADIPVTRLARLRPDAAMFPAAPERALRRRSIGSASRAPESRDLQPNSPPTDGARA